MRKILMIAAFLAAMPLSALAQDKAPEGGAQVPFEKQETQQAAKSPEDACKARNFVWSGDRCFTGRKCTMKNGHPGSEAIKDGQMGCSLTTAAYTDEQKQKLMDPDYAADLCKKSGATWSIDRCFTGKQCKRNDGSRGYEALKDGQLGCSQFGPRNVYGDQPRMPAPRKHKTSDI